MDARREEKNKMLLRNLPPPPTIPEVLPNGFGSRSVECFEKIEQVGEGTYGQVYMAREREPGEDPKQQGHNRNSKEPPTIVALKKVRMDNEKEGFPITAIREIKILSLLDCENVVRLKEIVTSGGKERDGAKGNSTKGSIYMVFEYMDHDLTGLIETMRESGKYFTLPQIKCLMRQLLYGLNYCHKNNVLHRDIKGSNMLISDGGVLKLADFGLARSYYDQAENEKAQQMTNRVITLWYRPPELILGETFYGPEVDMWGVGCILAELLMRKPILQGKDEADQLAKIYQLCGTATKENWPDVDKLPYFKTTTVNAKPWKRALREKFAKMPGIPDDYQQVAIDLIDKLLVLDPKKRLRAEDAYSHDFFLLDPKACDPNELPKFESSHEYQTKKKRHEAREAQQQGKVVQGHGGGGGGGDHGHQQKRPRQGGYQAGGGHQGGQHGSYRGGGGGPHAPYVAGASQGARSGHGGAGGGGGYQGGHGGGGGGYQGGHGGGGGYGGGGGGYQGGHGGGGGYGGGGGGYRPGAGHQPPRGGYQPPPGGRDAARPSYGGAPSGAGAPNTYRPGQPMPGSGGSSNNWQQQRR